MMKINAIYIIGCFVVLAMALNPATAFSELKSLDDAELSSVEAEGATVQADNTSANSSENRSVVSVAAGDSDPFDLNDPNRETNVFRPPAVNQNVYAAPKSQLNNFDRTPSCCSGRSGCP
jgi:hypothetical protein